MDIDVEVLVEKFLGETVPPEALDTPLPDAAAEKVIARLKKEADRHNGIDPHRSLEFAERIVAIGQARQDLREVALGTMARGDALKFLGRTEEAWDALEGAGKMFQSAGDEVGWARTIIGRLYLSTMLNRVENELVEAKRARDIFLHHSEQEMLVRLDWQIAYVHNYLGKPRKALKRYHAALAIAKVLGEAGVPHKGPLYANIGSTFETLGDIDNAKDYYHKAYKLFESRDETLNLATVETNIGLIEIAQGNHRRALQLLNRSLSRVDEIFHLEAAKIKWHLVDCYMGLNRHSEARDLARQLVDDFRELEDAYELARVLLLLGTIEAELANYQVARKALEEAEAIFNSLGATTRTAEVWLRRGRIGLQEGDAEEAHRQALRAAAQFESAGQQLNHAQAALLQGQALLRLGNLGRAAAAGVKALQAARRYNVPSLRYSAHLLLGQIAENGSHRQRAERHYQAAAATIDRVQRSLTITLQPGFLEDKDQTWRALIGLQLEQGQAEKAFETLERAKSQVLLGYLANRERLRWPQEDAHSRELIEELNRLRGEHQWLYRQVHEAPDGHEHGPAMEIDEALQELQKCERRMRAITEELYLYSAEGSAPVPAPAPPMAEIQGVLGESTALIEFYDDGERLWAFRLDRESIEVQPLAVRIEDLTILLAKLGLNLSTANKIGPQAPATSRLTELAKRVLGRIYDALLAPLGLDMRQVQRLVIVPYGALHYLPFHLLFDGSKYLIEKCEVVVLPAAGLATQQSPRREPGALILAHSWDGRLPHTQAEADRVARMFPGQIYRGEEARRSVLQRPPSQILHIAAHGKYRLEQPDLSFVQMADGQLYADDLLQQDLSYELVTLSACETGRAAVSGGDELIGVGRGFLYAGAGALIMSLWQVADETTTALMAAMYRRLRDGASKAAALRHAQRTMLAESGQLHPAFWGAFQLVGNPDPLSEQVD